MSLYPMTLSFATTWLLAPAELSIVVTSEGWQFGNDTDRVIFGELPMAERLRLRGEFEAQVELAKGTPTAQTMANFKGAGL